jgi:hypothetical protein
VEKSSSVRQTFSNKPLSVWLIFEAKQNTICVIVPLLPRYLFARCCSNRSHCTNSREKEYSQSLLSDFLQLRNLLIRLLVAKGLFQFQSVGCMLHTTWTNTANIATRLGEPRNVTAKDSTSTQTASWNWQTGYPHSCTPCWLPHHASKRNALAISAVLKVRSVHPMRTHNTAEHNMQPLHITPRVETAVHIAIAGPSFRTGVGPGRVSTQTAETRTAFCLAFWRFLCRSWYFSKRINGLVNMLCVRSANYICASVLP